MKRRMVTVLVAAVLLVWGSAYAEPEPPGPMGHMHGGMHADHHDGGGAMMPDAQAGCRCGMMGQGMKSMGMGSGMRCMSGQTGRGMMRGGMGMMKGMPHSGGHRQFMKQLWALNLDEKQKSAIKALHHRVMREMITKKAETALANLDLADILQNDPVDLAAAEAKIRAIQNLKTDRLVTVLKAKEEVKRLLTPEQREKLKSGQCRSCSMAMAGDGEDDDDGEDEDGGDDSDMGHH